MGARAQRDDVIENKNEHDVDSFDAHEKGVLALTQMGFRHADARRAVRAVETRPCAEGKRTLDALLREALLEATRAA